MKKVLLLAMLIGMISSCTYVPAGSLQDIPVANGFHRYKIIKVVIDNHDYIYLDGYSGENHIIHNPECKKCQTKQHEENELYSW
jgi:hypothetical protein